MNARWAARRRLRRQPELAHEITVQDCLTACRIHARLSRAQVADAMGTDVAWVLAFESGALDPRLSELRRYALTVGARLNPDVHIPAPSRKT